MYALYNSVAINLCKHIPRRRAIRESPLQEMVLTKWKKSPRSSNNNFSRYKQNKIWTKNNLPQRGRGILRSMRSKRRMRSPTHGVGVAKGDDLGKLQRFWFVCSVLLFATFGVADLLTNRTPHPPTSHKVGSNVPTSPLGKVRFCANISVALRKSSAKRLDFLVWANYIGVL